MRLRTKFVGSEFFLFALLFFVFSCKSKVTASDSKIHEDSGDFTVLSFSPEGELPSVVKFPSIQIQFSHPVVPLKQLGKPSDESDVVTIEPKIKGTFRWYGTSLLSFECSESVIPQKQYKITVNKKTTSLGGKKITGELEYSFHTQELQIVSIVPGYSEIQKGNYVDNDEVPVELASEIGVYFNAPVNKNHIKKQMTVSCDGKVVPYDVSDISESAILIKLKDNPSMNTTVQVSLPKGSMSDEDCYPTSEEQNQTFHTLRPLEVKEFSDEPRYLSSSFINPVQFTFNHQMKQGSEAEIAKHITTQPQMKIEAKNIALNGMTLVVHSLPVTFDSSYVINVDDGLSDAYGLKLVGGYKVEAKVPPAASFVYFKDSGFKMLESQFKPQLVFAYQNIINAGSKYSVTPLCLANGDKANGTAFSVNFDTIDSPKDTKITHAVDLTKELQQVGNSWRGGVRFAAFINYLYRYQDWSTNKVVTKQTTEDNTLVLQVTDLGVTVRYGYNRALVLVTSLATGKPVANAEINAYNVPFNITPTGYPDLDEPLKNKIGSARTDAKGFAVIEFSKESSQQIENDRNSLYIEAKTNDDRAIFRPNLVSMWRTAASNIDDLNYPRGHQSVAFIFTDRGLYKPGEVMTFRGIDRTLYEGKYIPANSCSYTIEITDGSWQPKVYTTINGDTTDNGTFWGKWKVPDNFEPGSYEIVYRRNQGTKEETQKTSIGFDVQFFERLRFEAKSTIPTLTYYSGDKINAEISAQYLGGGSLGGCKYSSYWSREPAGFTLSDVKFNNLSFGPLQGYDGWNSLDEGAGVLSGDGKATVGQQTGGEKLKGMTYSYRMEAQITDSGNQMISTSTRALVHPAKFYLGVSRIKGVKGFPVKGDTLKFDYLCVTPEGKAPLDKDVPSGKKNKLKIELQREDWKEVQQIGWNGQINTRYVREMITEQEKEEKLDSSGKLTEISVVPPKGGSYVLRLSTQDARGNEVITEKRFYVTSSDWTWFDRDDSEEITMTCDQDLYAIGDTAHILLQSPLPKGTYMMTIEREGIISQEIRTITQQSTVIDIPVKENFVPVMYVTLSSYSVRSGLPTNDFNKPDLDKPKGYFGLAAIHVNTDSKKFDIEIKTDKPSYKPGETAKISLHASKNGVSLDNAEITLMAVDRGVIDLINYHVADPVYYFYNDYLFPDCVKGGDSRSLLIDPVTYEIRNLVGGDEALEKKALSENGKISERKNFEPTALFVPSLRTDKDGNVSYSFKLPDSLTAYRITAVGVNANDFALSEDEMPVANPVSVRDVIPRKLRVSDKGETGVTISNLDAIAHTVTINLAVYSGIDKTGTVQAVDEIQKMPGNATVIGPIQKEITVEPNSTVPLMFELNAKKEGWITIEYTVNSDIVNERILKPLEIEKPYIYETVTTVGEVRSDDKKEATAEEKIVIPQNSEDGKGNIYVQLDSTRLGVLRSAVDYVFRYPYGCLEQRSSFVLPLISFGDYIDIFGLESEVKKPLDVAAKEITSWGKAQKEDGGFPYWPDGNYSDFNVSLRIGEILALAKEKKISFESKINTAALSSFIQVKKQSLVAKYHDSGWTNYASAYANYVLSRLGGQVSESDIKNVADSKYADISSLAFCALTYYQLGKKSQAEQIAKKIRSYTKYSTRGIDVTSMQGEFESWSYFNDKSEDYALLLQLFSTLDPQNDINQHLLFELLEFERAGNGYWKSTAVTSRVLCAIDVYIRANNLEDNNFTAEVLLDGKKLADGKFKGLGAKPVDKSIDFAEEPVKSMKREKELPLVFSKKGTGTLFYTASMKYAVPAEEQYARDEGICIFTEITDVKTGEVVDGDTLVAGNVYREKVFVVSTRDREYVAVRAPIPSGCEVMNAAFVTTGTFPQKTQEKDPDASVDVYSDDGWDYSDYWYEDPNYGLSHQAIYDNEVQYFWDLFAKGNQQVEFLFRATRKGTYATPSSTAECMYQPEVFGRSAGKVWTIE